MAHHGDDPSGSAYIKEEPADGEGIYASTGRERTFAEIFHVRPEYGLTVQSNQQARDQDLFPVPRSLLEGAELDAMWESLGFGPDPVQTTPQRPNPRIPFPHYFPDELDEQSMSRALSVSTPFSFFNGAKASLQLDPVTEESVQQNSRQSTQQSTRTTDFIDPDLFDYRGDESTSQTPSVSTPPCDASRAKALRQTEQSECYASGSETPPTDVDEDSVQHAIAQPALAGAQQHIAQQTLPGIQQLTLHSMAPVATDADTLMPSVERAALSQKGEPLAGKSESQEIALARSTNITPNSSPAQLDPATSQDFATFMQLRNSFPIAAIMAMIAPSNKSQVVSTLAEIADAQGLITGSDIAQSPTSEIPSEMRAILDNLKHKFNSDKSFLTSVIFYITEQLKNDGKFPSGNIVQLLTDIGQAEAGAKPVDLDKLLRIGIDELATLSEAQKQLLKERKHYHKLISDQDAVLNEYKARDAKIEREIQEMMANSPIPSLGQPGSAFPTPSLSPSGPAFPTPNSSPSGPMFPPMPIGEPQPELNWDGSIKDNRFWICRLMKFDGSGLPCHGLNQEWVRRLSNHEGIATAKWYLRENCMKCRRANKSNRKYLKDGEARMLRPLMGQSTNPSIQQNGGQSMANVQQRKRKAPPAEFELPAAKKIVPLPAEHNGEEDMEFEKYLNEALDASYFD